MSLLTVLANAALWIAVIGLGYMLLTGRGHGGD